MRRSPSDRDRKSTRLNSSHQIISYAVFCLNHLYTTQSHTLSLHDALPISLAGKVDGRVVDTSHRIDQDASVAIVTERDPEGLDVIRHSTAHLLAYAVKELFPDAQVTIGPRSEEHTSELQSPDHLVCRLLLESPVHHTEPHSFPTRRSSDLTRRQGRRSGRRYVAPDRSGRQRGDRHRTRPGRSRRHPPFHRAPSRLRGEGAVPRCAGHHRTEIGRAHV